MSTMAEQTRHPTAAEEALEERDRVLDEVTAAHPHTSSAGLQVLEAWAAKGKPFSLNDCRADLRAAGVVGQFAPGAVVRRAIQLRIIRKVDATISTSGPTHGKAISVYVAGDQRGGVSTLIPSGERVTVPVQRTPAGRFTNTADAGGTPALFDVEVTQ